MSLKERGHFPNTLKFNSIKKVVLSDAGITLKIGSKDIFHTWQEIKDVSIELRDAMKGYGAAASVEFLQRTLVLCTECKKYRIDVSHEFPDFSNSSKLEEYISKKYDIREVKIKRKKSKVKDIAFYIAMIIIILYLKDYST